MGLKQVSQPVGKNISVDVIRYINIKVIQGSWFSS